MSHLALHGTVSVQFTTYVRDAYNDLMMENADIMEAVDGKP